MLRKQIYLTAEQQRVLTELAEATGKSESAVIREAIDQLAARLAVVRRREALERGFGLWKDRRDLPDFDALRRESDLRLEGPCSEREDGRAT